LQLLLDTKQIFNKWPQLIMMENSTMVVIFCRRYLFESLLFFVCVEAYIFGLFVCVYTKNLLLQVRIHPTIPDEFHTSTTVTSFWVEIELLFLCIETIYILINGIIWVSYCERKYEISIMVVIFLFFWGMCSNNFKFGRFIYCPTKKLFRYWI
jgi:hypothetical protein